MVGGSSLKRAGCKGVPEGRGGGGYCLEATDHRGTSELPPPADALLHPLQTFNVGVLEGWGGPQRAEEDYPSPEDF
jgi:hypothetical protein